MVRVLGLAVAALLTANGVIVAEQVSGRDLITLGGDGLSNAREAIAKLLEDNKTPQVAGAVLEQSSTTTTTAPAETTTSTAAPVAPPPEAPAASAPPGAPAATPPTTAKKPSNNGAVDWPHVADTVRPYIEKE